MLNPMLSLTAVTSPVCHDITPVPSILNQSPRACILMQGSVPGIHLEDVDDL